MEPPTPLPPFQDTVRSEWIDFNGHMNVAYFVLTFDHAIDQVLEYLGLGEEYVRLENASVFAVDMNISYRRELRDGELFMVTTQLLGYDEKRIHFFQEMFRDGGDLAATNEILVIHVDLEIRRAAAFPPSASSILAELGSAHRKLPLPEGAGRIIELAEDFHKNVG